MKKILIYLFVFLILQSCASLNRKTPVASLKDKVENVIVGMSKTEVEEIMGFSYNHEGKRYVNGIETEVISYKSLGYHGVDRYIFYFQNNKLIDMTYEEAKAQK